MYDIGKDSFQSFASPHSFRLVVGFNVEKMHREDALSRGFGSRASKTFEERSSVDLCG